MPGREAGVEAAEAVVNMSVKMASIWCSYIEIYFALSTGLMLGGGCWIIFND